MRILVGTAGTPSMCRGIIEALDMVPKLGLDCMEVEFTYGVNMKNDLAKSVGEEKTIELSVHAPYYVNLNSKEGKKIAESEKRILESAERAHHMSASPVVFHSGFYSGRTPADAYDVFRQEIDDLAQVADERGYDVRLAPETTGKYTQFGSLDELIKLCQDVERVSMTVDWAHLWARAQGKLNFNAVLDRIADELGKEFLRDMHMHFSGMEYTKAGERKHHDIDDSAFPWKDMCRALAEHKVKGKLICESPALEIDALKVKALLKELGN
ncbi:MAG: TIM barrel protein [Candidatus Diapherotrites archaeon]|nr:TIM barrel protein [Candidatus Diapherotrites archaeon]